MRILRPSCRPTTLFLPSVPTTPSPTDHRSKTSTGTPSADPYHPAPLAPLLVPLVLCFCCIEKQHIDLLPLPPCHSGDQPLGLAPPPRKLQTPRQQPVYGYTVMTGGGAVPSSSIKDDDEMKAIAPELYEAPKKRLLTTKEVFEKLEEAAKVKVGTPSSLRDPSH